MKGFAVLPMVVFMSLIIGVVVATLAFLGVSEVTQSTKGRDANYAFLVAQAGIDDATIRIARNLNYSNGSGYTLAVENGTSTVIVQKDTFSSPCTAVSATGKDCIISTGQVKDSKRRIEVVVTIGTYGKVTVDSFKEIAP